jgi:hypothetical protein
MNTTLKLSRPVKGPDGGTTSELTLRELTVDENIALERQSTGKGTLEQDKAFFAMSCGVSPDVIGAMGQRDWMRLKNLYWGTLGNVEPEPESLEP